MTAVTGPAPSAQPLTPDAAAALVGRSAGRLRRHLGDGTLHGHRPRHIRGARWVIAEAALWAWWAGLDEDAQRRVCPLCPLASVTTTRGRRKSHP